MNTDIHHIDITTIKPFVSRARPKDGFERMKESIREFGLRVPIQVRDISAWPRDKRGSYKYELIAGEGRVKAFKALRRPTIPALVVDVAESEVVGRFLAENVMRKKMSWLAKAQLMKEEVDRIGMPTKNDLEVLAQRYFVSVPHMTKLIKILKQSSPHIQKDIDKFTVQEAETLTSLPAKGQEIVVQTLLEEGIPKADVAVVVRKAKELSEADKELSKTALKQSLKRLGEELRRLRESAKNIRHKYSLGPENLLMLLSDAEFREALDRKRIGYTKFMEAAQ